MKQITSGIGVKELVLIEKLVLNSWCSKEKNWC
jgi:hypothetical protein